MSKLGDVMNSIFGPKPQNTVPIPGQVSPQNTQVQGAQPGQITNNPANNPVPAGTQVSGVTDANGVVPKDSDASPLVEFKDLWQPTPTDPNAPKNVPQGVSPEKLMEAASKVDFSKVLDQESLAKIAAGGQEAVIALSTLLNKTAQQVYGQSMVVTSRIVDQAVQEATARFAASVPSLVRNQSVNENLFAKNPALQDPAVAPVVQAIQSQLAEKYPKASSLELVAMAERILSGAAEKFAPQKASETKPQGRAEEDWSAYLN
jgi:hypothetical protein